MVRIEEIKSFQNIENKDVQIHSFINGLPTKNGFIDFSQLESIGHGGTHDVYIYPQNSEYVIKLNRGVLEKVLDSGQNELSPELRLLAEKHVNDENDNYAQLYKYFGEENCLREKLAIKKISIEQDEKTLNIESLISVQKASNVFKDPNKKDFSTSYAEKILDDTDKEHYQKMNNALLGDAEFTLADFLHFNQKLKPIFELIDSDKNFANSMKNFLLRFKQYLEASGKFIDLVGEENVLFYQNNGKWNFQLGSVLKAETKQNVEEALKILEEDPNEINSGPIKINSHLMNGLALIRLLNATGLKTGLGKIIKISLSEKQLQNLEIIKFQ